jgi:hypothetical protein
VRGREDQRARLVIASYVDEILIYPETKTGEMRLDRQAAAMLEPTTTSAKENDRPNGRSCADQIAGAGFEPATFGLCEHTVP